MIRIKGYMLGRVPVLGCKNKMPLFFQNFRGLLYLINKGLIRTINGEGTVFPGGKIALYINNNNADIFSCVCDSKPPFFVFKFNSLNKMRA